MFTNTTIYHSFISLGDFTRAPELLADYRLPPTEASDVYSYSIILYEICTRLEPFELVIRDMEISPTGNRCLLSKSFYFSSTGAILLFFRN